MKTGGTWGFKDTGVGCSQDSVLVVVLGLYCGYTGVV